jgi:hypothetical protein
MQLMSVAKSADEVNFDKMKAAYDACLNEDQIKSIGAEPLKHVLEEIRKVYPAATSDSLSTVSLDSSQLAQVRTRPTQTLSSCLLARPGASDYLPKSATKTTSLSRSTVV